MSTIRPGGRAALTVWHTRPARACTNGVLGGAVRLRLTVLKQEPDVQQRIRAAFDRRLAAEGGSVRVSPKLGSGRKP